MTTVFCPGHITCFFRPVITGDINTTGSVGVGMKISLGSEVTIEERNDHRIVTTLNGTPTESKVIDRVVKTLAPKKGFDITIQNDLPVSQGFGMSAAGAIAAGMCISKMYGSEDELVFKAAHTAEIEEGGGLGDVLGIMNRGFVSVRTKAGILPYGNVYGIGKRMRITLAVIGQPIDTGGILSDGNAMKRIVMAGDDAMARYNNCSDIFATSRIFSRDAGLENTEMQRALNELGNEAAMCMLGNSLFTTYPEDTVSDVLGNAETYECETTDSMPIIRKG